MTNPHTSYSRAYSTRLPPPLPSTKHVCLILVYVLEDDEPDGFLHPEDATKPDRTCDPLANLIENLPEPNLSPAGVTEVKQAASINPVPHGTELPAYADLTRPVLRRIKFDA